MIDISHIQPFTHYFLHLGFPFIIARCFFKDDWKKCYLIFLATMIVDLDHLLADPIFAPDRCSIGFHPLHSFYAILLYLFMFFFRRPFRIIAIGLLFHMITDFIDCLFMYYKCSSCLADSPVISVLEFVSENIFSF